jgi:diguanylate cyclase (GGDEF)-like protein
VHSTVEKKTCVLVVDDEPKILHVVREILGSEYEVTTAEDGAKALDALQKMTFQVALVDDRLPDLRGLDLVARIKKEWPDLVRVLMSGCADPETLIRAINEGQVAGFVEKPFEPARLRTLMSQAAQFARLTAERNEALALLDKQKRDLEYLVDQRTHQLEERNRQLEVLATRDPLTGLHNRRYLEQRLEQELARLKRYATPYSVILCDLDDFKRFNDTLGHAAGDHVLVQVSSTLANNLRKVDLVGRFGGEEFLLILPNTTLADAERTAERLRKAICSLTGPIVGEVGAIAMSAGVSPAHPSDPTWKTAVDRADEALYQAKRSGKNTVRSRA